MIEWKVDLPHLKLGLGDCSAYEGDADLVFTDLYGPLPPQLLDKPAIINLVGPHKIEKARKWLGRELHPIGIWGAEKRNHVYVMNMAPKPVEIGDLVEEEIGPRQGCFPLALPVRLLGAYAPPWEITVYDGCMGRGTVGKAALLQHHRYVGVDSDPARVELAKAYLGC